MVTDLKLEGVNPPVQKRSRAALQRVLQAATDVLRTEGADGFTIAAVAARSNTSVGGIYRRFTGKEQLLAAVKAQLLSQVDERLEEQVAAEAADLRTAITVYTLAVASTVGAEYGTVIAELLRGRNPELDDLGRGAMLNFAHRFDDALSTHRSEVVRSDADQAIAAVRSTIISACIHRAVSGQDAGDQRAWSEYGTRLADMSVLYLTTPEH
ncbi:hypothetical protein JCM18899A_10610 [Nocardioides sp. AN3]